MSPSLIARLVIEPALRIAGVKTVTKTEARARRYVARLAARSQSAKPPRGVKASRDLDSSTGWCVYQRSPEKQTPSASVIYLHGGGYVQEIRRHHWAFCAMLAEAVPATVQVPIYPLAPHATAASTIPALTELVRKVRAANPERPLFVAGDSAGAAMALAVAQPLRDQQAAGLIDGLVLISPWLDATMSNPEHPKPQRRDRIQSMPGLREFGRAYAGDLALDNPFVSPFFGDMHGLPPTLVVTGTADMFSANVSILEQTLHQAGTHIEVLKGIGMQHIYPLMPLIPEGAHARDHISAWIRTSIRSLGRRP